ncbi:cation/H(+) antiporter 20-like [Phoenix dactylifera]|uniref:Cation/H(+) antiporter 20-like n=1 Tax=Phoenix dactylifera TaxID=42345 RepID=A0A8B8J015_PHODC|nr:cation/H(+) antiporter 20-like [Phoenix dactylifera]
MATATNMTTVKISSDGAWQGENPLKYALPLLIIQTTLILVLSRALAFLFKPLRQPKVVAEIVGGIVLGPSALGRWKAYLRAIFPSWSSPILDTISSVGLLFFLFLVGLELDLHSIRRSGRRAFAIAAVGILLPFLSSIGVVLLLRRTTLFPSSNDIGFYPFLVFVGVALSITAFPVLARILAELKLLTTGVGETAMAAAAFNDVVAWILLALAVALSGDGGSGRAGTPLVSLWIILSSSLFVVFMMTAVRPVMAWIARRSNRAVEEACICLTLAGVLVSGFATDLIGIHSIFGAFVFGLTIPKEGEFAGKLLERIEDFVSGLLLPLYFASSGLKTDVAKIRGAQAWGLLVLVITIACVGKIAGTFVVAVSSKIPAREAATLGVLMGTKGLVELIVLNIGKEKKVLNDETFTILVLMALFTTFITTPTVMAIYKPTARYNSRFPSESPSFSSPSSSGKRNKYLRILACLHSPANAPSIINLIDTIRGAEKARLKLYVMHLVELTERPSSIFTALRARKNGRPAHHSHRMETCSDLGRVTVMGAFQLYEKLGHVKIRRMTAISALATMDEDVCHVAEDKRVGLVILPFHKRGGAEGGMEVEDLGEAWGGVNQRVLAHAPCSVGLLVDRGFAGPMKTARGICVVFIGGPDDREALLVATMMRGSPGVSLAVIRFLKRGDIDGQQQSEEEEEELDEEAVAEIRRSDGYATYEERRAEDAMESVLSIGRSGDYELVVVGRGRSSSKAAAAGLRGWWTEHAELGPVGNILASQGHGLVSSVLVVQQHSILHSIPMPLPGTMDGERRSPPGLAICSTV